MSCGQSRAAEGSTQGDCLSQEWDVTLEILTQKKLDEAVAEEKGKCWQESGIEGVNLVPFWGLLSDVCRVFRSFRSCSSLLLTEGFLFPPPLFFLNKLSNLSNHCEFQAGASSYCKLHVDKTELAA